MNRRQLLQALIASGVSHYAWSDALDSGHGAHTDYPLPNDGYKALVCLFLAGGNDGWNTLIPLADEAQAGAGRGYQSYHHWRKAMSVAQQPLELPETLAFSAASDNPYHEKSLSAQYLKGTYPIEQGQWGIHGCMPELATLYQQQKLAWIANTGVLAEPVSQSSIKHKQLPHFLYAHNHQTRQIETADALKQHHLGWAGRLADLWQSGQARGINHGHLLGMNTAIGKSSHAFSAATSAQLVLPAGRPLRISGLSPKSQADWQALYQQTQANIWSALVADEQAKALALAELFQAEWKKTHDYSEITGPYGEAMFSAPKSALTHVGGTLGTGLMKQLETVVRSIEIGQKQGLRRQVFTVRLGGFDTHAEQATKHLRLLREVSLALWHFQTALKALGVEEQVMLFSQSEFGRTLTPNTSGTDHAWSSHQLVMGSAIQAKVHGQMPDLRAESENMQKDRRGRVIPSMAIEQVTAPLLRWFGVKESDLGIVLPRLDRFDAEAVSLFA